MAIGARGLSVQKGTTADGKPAAALVYGGPINAIVAGLDDAINSLTGGGALYTVSDPTKADPRLAATDRKSTRLNSSHLVISYAVFCLKKKKKNKKMSKPQLQGES